MFKIIILLRGIFVDILSVIVGDSGVVFVKKFRYFRVKVRWIGLFIFMVI